MILLSASEILLIPVEKPELLFNKDDIETQRQHYLKKFHPDKGGDEEVFKHIQKLYKKGIEKISNNVWAGRASLKFTDVDKKKTFNFHYSTMEDINIGKLYIAETHAMYMIDAQNNDLFQNGIKAITRMQTHVKQYASLAHTIPTIAGMGKTDAGESYVVFKLPGFFVRLRDILDSGQYDKLPPKMVAWITTRLMDFNCLLNDGNTCHLGLSPETIWVDTENHSICVAGGWWYSRLTNEKFIALPQFTVSALTSKDLLDKTAKPKYDSYTIKKTAIVLLGDKSGIGSSLLMTDIPKCIVAFYRSISGDNVVEVYKKWEDVLTEGWGKRVFFKHEIHFRDIFKR